MKIVNKEGLIRVAVDIKPVEAPECERTYLINIPGLNTKIWLLINVEVKIWRFSSSRLSFCLFLY